MVQIQRDSHFVIPLGGGVESYFHYYGLASVDPSGSRGYFEGFITLERGGVHGPDELAVLGVGDGDVLIGRVAFFQLAHDYLLSKMNFLGSHDEFRL
jgi:hypothetical protein